MTGIIIRNWYFIFVFFCADQATYKHFRFAFYNKKSFLSVFLQLAVIKDIFIMTTRTLFCTMGEF